MHCIFLSVECHTNCWCFVWNVRTLLCTFQALHVDSPQVGKEKAALDVLKTVHRINHWRDKTAVYPVCALWVVIT